MKDYDFTVYATQGGGLVKWDDNCYVFVEAPPEVMGLKVGDIMPHEWGVVPMSDSIPTESMRDEMLDGWYGSFAFRTDANRSIWKCYDSSDYSYTAITDDFGRLARISELKNMRGY